MEYPPTALSYGEKTIQTKKGDLTFPIPIGTYGNFSFVQAPPKTKKTFFISLLASVYLSGGNQQKIVLGKWLLRNPDILIVDEPTHGIDVGAKSEIYRLFNKLSASGTAILMISSELSELIGLCDRILVMSHGELMASIDRPDFSEEDIIQYSSGLKRMS